MMKRILCLFGAALILTLSVFAAIEVPEPTDCFYVNDFANVLSEETVEYVAARAEFLEDKTGAQMVVVTVESTYDASSENYAYTLYNNWGIGDKAGNGFLLLLVMDRLGYWMMTGEAAESYLPAYELQQIADGDFLDCYDAGDTDGAVRYCMAQVLHVFSHHFFIDEYEAEEEPAESYGEDWYPAESLTGDYAGYGDYGGYESGYLPFSSGAGLGKARTIILLIIAYMILRSVLRNLGGGRRRGGAFFIPMFFRPSNFRGSNFTNNSFHSSGGSYHSSGGSFHSSGGHSSGGFSHHSGGGGHSRGGGVGR